MIIRVLLAGFASFVGGICYLSGLTRLMSSLLLGFGCLMSLFFGAIFAIPNSENILGFPVHGSGGAWPFFMLAVTLAVITLFLLAKKPSQVEYEQLSLDHVKFLGGGLLTCLASIFIPGFLWFPSEVRRLTVDQASLGMEVFAGTIVYLIGISCAIYLLYRATRGGTKGRPDFMKRVVLAIFAVFHLDKIPVLIAYLLIYSPETQIIFPKLAALALASYIPVAIFLWKTGADSE